MRSAENRFWIGILTLLAIGGARISAGQEETAVDWTAEADVQVEPPARPSEPDAAAPFSIELSHRPYPEGIGDESAYAVWLDDRVLELRHRLTDGLTLKDVQNDLAFAELLLARRIEPDLSRMLLELPTVEQAAPFAEEAFKVTEQARGKLERMDEANIDAEELAALRRTQSLLSAFTSAAAQLFAPVAVEEESEDFIAAFEGVEDLRRAASELAITTEDGSPELVAASRLWRSLLLERAGLTDRVTALLPLALSPPSPHALAWEYFARLQRCRLLYEGKENPSQEGHAAAWALLLQLEDAAFEWFKDEGQRQEAVRTAAWFRYRLLAQWREAREKEASAQERDWFQKAEQRLVEQHFSGPGPLTVLRLESAIPPVIEPKTDVRSKLPAPAAPVKPNDTGESNEPQ